MFGISQQISTSPVCESSVRVRLLTYRVYDRRSALKIRISLIKFATTSRIRTPNAKPKWPYAQSNCPQRSAWKHVEKHKVVEIIGPNNSNGTNLKPLALLRSGLQRAARQHTIGNKYPLNFSKLLTYAIFRVSPTAEG